ncbi:hypothetical protein GQ42DRAFT_159899 [Ramicandelaber brevisporus]|nr:hypothetical protein GQ42DRAFT_159899 [Ramicandelaber brevisporus]
MDQQLHARGGGGDGGGMPLPLSMHSTTLYEFDSLDADDHLEVAWSEHHHKLLHVLHSQPESEANSTIQQQAFSDNGLGQAFTLGILYSILSPAVSALDTDIFSSDQIMIGPGPDGSIRIPASRLLRLLQLINRDSFNFLVQSFYIFIQNNKRFDRITMETRRRIMWLLQRLIEMHVKGLEQVVKALFRQMRGGDLSNPNLFLCDIMCQLLHRHSRAWAMQYPDIYVTAVYCFLRLIPDHVTIEQVYRQEIAFCVDMLSNHFGDIMRVGRDLIRALQDVSRIPEFNEIWIRIIHHPQSLHQSFTGISQLLMQPTHYQYLLSRIPNDMEDLFGAILGSHPGSFNRYISWLYDRYLHQQPSDRLFSDIVRYVVSAITTQERHCPRFVILLSLLRYVRTPHLGASVKLSLMLDWIGFNNSQDSKDKVEPLAHLLFRASDDPHTVYMARTCIEHLRMLANEFYPRLRPLFVQNIQNALHCAVNNKLILPADVDRLGVNLSVAPELHAAYNDLFMSRINPSHIHQVLNQAQHQNQQQQQKQLEQQEHEHEQENEQEHEHPQQKQQQQQQQQQMEQASSESQQSFTDEATQLVDRMDVDEVPVTSPTGSDNTNFLSFFEDADDSLGAGNRSGGGGGGGIGSRMSPRKSALSSRRSSASSSHTLSSSTTAAATSAAAILQASAATSQHQQQPSTVTQFGTRIDNLVYGLQNYSSTTMAASAWSNLQVRINQIIEALPTAKDADMDRLSNLISDQISSATFMPVTAEQVVEMLQYSNEQLRQIRASPRNFVTAFIHALVQSVVIRPSTQLFKSINSLLIRLSNNAVTSESVSLRLHLLMCILCECRLYNSRDIIQNLAAIYRELCESMSVQVMDAILADYNELVMISPDQLCSFVMAISTLFGDTVQNDIVYIRLVASRLCPGDVSVLSRSMLMGSNFRLVSDQMICGLIMDMRQWPAVDQIMVWPLICTQFTGNSPIVQSILSAVCSNGDNTCTSEEHIGILQLIETLTPDAQLVQFIFDLVKAVMESHKLSQQQLNIADARLVISVSTLALWARSPVLRTLMWSSWQQLIPPARRQQAQAQAQAQVQQQRRRNSSDLFADDDDDDDDNDNNNDGVNSGENNGMITDNANHRSTNGTSSNTADSSVRESLRTLLTWTRDHAVPGISQHHSASTGQDSALVQLLNQMLESLDNVASAPAIIPPPAVVPPSRSSSNNSNHSTIPLKRGRSTPPSPLKPQIQRQATNPKRMRGISLTDPDDDDDDG